MGSNNPGERTENYTITMKLEMEESMVSNAQTSAMHLKMSKSWWSISATLFFLIILLAGCADNNNFLTRRTSAVELPYYAEATFTPHWLSSDCPELDTFHRVSDFSLLNQAGHTITLDSLQNKVFVVDFFFTSCPGICPRMTSNMGLLQEAFSQEDRVMLLSHSVMPKYDSVAALREYAEAKGVDEKKWWLLTGDRDQIYRLGRHDYFVEEDLGIEKNTDDFLHTENFVLVDQNQHIRGIYNGLNKASVEQLKQDIASLLATS